LRFENVVEALVEATRALKEFRHLEIKRGEALALTTRGLAYRLQAEKRIDQKEGSEAILKDLTRAEADLQEAQNIFSGEVQEPLRELQACNELACCYRDEYMLLRKKGDAKGQKDAMKNGKGCFQHALEIAEQHGFRIEKLDTLQDRAVLYMRAKQFELARADLKVIRQAIPLDHRLERGRGFVKLAMETRIDAYYKLMGQVELLEGAIMFEETHAAQPDRQPDSSVIEAMLEHYVLAVAYFNSYSGESVTNRQTNFRIYARLRGLNRQYLSELRDILIPKWMQEYNLPLEMVYGTFEEVFGLLIPGSKGRNWGGSDRR